MTATAAVLCGCVSAAEPYIKPGDRYTEVRTPHVRAFVPSTQAAELTPLVQRADAIYAAMARAAGRPITERLDLLFSDEVDDHNGFSTVIPRPLIQVLLAPAAPSSTIFDGSDHIERTLIHELAHHLSNDRNHGFRGVLERIFGRVLPHDLASLLVFYLSTPAHVTMPSLWHEGLAQWAETVYAPTDSAWGGRGRDPLVHAVWRMDAAAGKIPPVGDWKLSHARWPFGSSAYLYGLAYFRWLEGVHGQRAHAWQLVDAHARRWAFAFDGATTALLGADHTHLLAQARNDLLQEQRAHLATLRTQPITTTTRLTKSDTVVSAPAWTRDGRLLAALHDPWDRPRLIVVDGAGRAVRSGWDAFARGEVRSAGEEVYVRAETPSALWAWARSRVELIIDSRIVPLDGERLLQPDARVRAGQVDVVAIQLQPGGQQTLVRARTEITRGLLGPSVDAVEWQMLPSSGRPWSPTLDAAAGRLAWVETDATGSRLMLAPFADLTQRTVLVQVRGRILHPVWSPDGTQLFFCSDSSGVANAYAIPVSGGEPVAVTHTIGAIIACVPNPDGTQLALVAHDHDGPYLAIIPNDPATWPGTVPQISASWPAPVAGTPAPARTLEVGEPAAVTSSSPYRGLTRIRPQFWTPTTLASPDGGLGLFAYAADPLMTHQLAASAGIGPSGHEPVGQLTWLYSGWPLEIGVTGWQSERTYNNLLLDTVGNDHDYVERLRAAEVFAGRGLVGDRRRVFAYATAGIAAWRTSTSGAEEYEDATIVTGGLFTGDERYVEGVVGYGDSRLFPTSFAREQGIDAAVQVRRSGFGGDLEQTRVIGMGDLTWSVWPRGGHQLRVSGQLGRSFGDETLQGSFSVGGILGLGLPRGYYDIEAVGTWLIGGSVAYRFPIWRPFHGFGSSPWVHRQVALEFFYDAAEVSTDQFFGDGRIYESAGMEIHDEWEFYGLRLQPGIGIAQQLDGDEDTVVYVTLSFR